MSAVASTLFSKNPNLNTCLNALGSMFNPMRVEMQEIREFDTLRIGFVAETRQGMRFVSYAEMDMNELAMASDPVKRATEFGIRIGFAAVDKLPEAMFGKYPIIRMWHDNHLNGTKALFGNPEVNIPGWVFPKYKEKSGWPPVGTTDPISTEVSSDGNSFGYDDPDDYTDRLKASVLDKQLADQRQEMLKVAKEAGKKKRVVNRTPPIAVSNGIKPRCRDHKSEMKFNPIRGKWVCEYDGCKIVATPKKDEDDRTVTLGKGEVTLRVIATDDGKTTLLLISDDNIALNITDLVAVDDFVRHEDLLDTAKNATDSGRDEFAEANPKYLGLRARVAVIGADALLEQHGGL